MVFQDAGNTQVQRSLSLGGSSALSDDHPKVKNQKVSTWPGSRSLAARLGLRQKSRVASAAITTLLTVCVFTLDKLILDFQPDLSFTWLFDDDCLLFYLLGIGAGYVFFSNRDGSNKSVKSSKSGPSVKCEADSTPRLPLVVGRGKSCDSEADSTGMHTESPCSAKPGSASRLNYRLNQAMVKESAVRAARILPNLESEGWTSDTTSYNIVIRGLANSGKLRQAEAFLDRLFEQGLQPNEHTYVGLMNACMKADDSESAEHWMKKMLAANVEGTNISYSLLIHACARLGDVRRAEAWLRKMVDEGITPSAANYNSFIHACSLQCRADLAEKWLEEMVGRGLEPSVMTFTALIDACAKSLDLLRAERWMEHMIASGLEPNVVSYSTMINACAKVGDLARAEYWYAKMEAKDVQPNAYTYSGLINACAKVQDVKAARKWLARAESAGSALDAVIYGCVINACGKVGDAEGAMSVYRQMRSNGISSHIVIYSSLARPFAYVGDWEAVEQIADEMIQDGFAINDYFLYTMLLAYSRAKPRQPLRAERKFVEVLEQGVQTNDRIFKALSSAVGRQRAIQLTENHSSRS